MTPTVGRTVHYFPKPSDGFAGNEPRAAVIVAVTGVAPHNVALHVFGAIGEPDRKIPHVPQEQRADIDQPAPGHWTWPPRV